MDSYSEKKELYREGNIAKKRGLGLWEKYLTLWVFLCIVVGIALGRIFPDLSVALSKLEIAKVSIPIALCLFWMIYPIMVQIDFRRVAVAGRMPKPIATTLIANWGIKPFTMAFFAWLFLGVIFKNVIPHSAALEYRAGMILLGVAPCTAMVLMWSYLARGNMAHTLVMCAINSLSMVILYAPLSGLLLGVSGIPIPWATIAFSVLIYIGVPLFAGYLTRTISIKKRGLAWFNHRVVAPLKIVAVIALLATLVLIFAFQGHVIVSLPGAIGMITVGIFANIIVVFVLTYLVAKIIGIGYEDAAPSAIIAGSNHFEVAIAVATTLFGVESGAALATVVGVLTEVPIMLFLVWLCKRTKWFFQKDNSMQIDGSTIR